MAEKHSGDQLSTKETREKTISDAVRLVNTEIGAAKKRLEDIWTEKARPIFIHGETYSGYSALVAVSSKVLAKIMLEYNYPFWNILGQDAPDEMWGKIATLTGLESITSVDISLKPKYMDEE